MIEDRMKNIKNLIPEDVKTLLKDIATNSTGLDVYLGGGYLRDLYVGNTPKDIDIFLAPFSNDSWNGVEYIPTRTMVTYRKSTDDILIKSDMEARGLQRLTGVFLIDFTYIKDVQYITYSKPMSLHDVAYDFDMGICQITYDPLTDELYYTSNFVKGHTEKEIECFHEYDIDRTIARFERMEAKFPDYKVVNKPEIVVEEVLDSGVSLPINNTPRKSQSNSV